MITKPVCPIGLVDFLDCRTCYWQRDGKCAFKRESKGKLISCPYCQAKFQTNAKPELQQCPKCRASLLV